MEGTKFGVTTRDETAIWASMCRRVELVLIKVTIEANFLATNFGSLDVVLGIPWQCSIGFMGIHWPLRSIAFMIGNQTIILHGDPSLITIECSLKTLTKSWEEGDSGYWVEV